MGCWARGRQLRVQKKKGPVLLLEVACSWVLERNISSDKGRLLCLLVLNMLMLALCRRVEESLLRWWCEETCRCRCKVR